MWLLCWPLACCTYCQWQVLGHPVNSQCVSQQLGTVFAKINNYLTYNSHLTCCSLLCIILVSSYQGNCSWAVIIMCISFFYNSSFNLYWCTPFNLCGYTNSTDQLWLGQTGYTKRCLFGLLFWYRLEKHSWDKRPKKSLFTSFGEITTQCLGRTLHVCFGKKEQVTTVWKSYVSQGCCYTILPKVLGFLSSRTNMGGVE